MDIENQQQPNNYIFAFINRFLVSIFLTFHGFLFYNNYLDYDVIKSYRFIIILSGNDVRLVELFLSMIALLSLMLVFMDIYFLISKVNIHLDRFYCFIAFIHALAYGIFIYLLKKVLDEIELEDILDDGEIIDLGELFGIENGDQTRRYLLFGFSFIPILYYLFRKSHQ